MRLLASLNFFQCAELKDYIDGGEGEGVSEAGRGEGGGGRGGGGGVRVG